ncbi:MAG: hypothetical protein AAFR59_14995, partial [Bacteroidota bacterium]
HHIHTLYRPWPINYIAYDLKEGGDRYAAHYRDQDKERFIEYLRQQMEDLKGDPQKLYAHLLQIYAGPIQTASQNKTRPLVGDGQQ